MTQVLEDLKSGLSEAIPRLTTVRSSYHHKDLERLGERGDTYHYGPMCQVLKQACLVGTDFS